MDTKDQNSGIPETLSPNPVAGSLETEFQHIPLEERVPESEQLQVTPRTPLQDSFRHFKHDMRAMICLGVLTFIVLVAIFGPLIYTHIGGTFNSPDSGVVGPTVYHTFSHQELSMQDQGPSAMYWLGTDSIGRDLFARLMQGLRVSLMVAILVEIITDGIGISIGILAGFYGAWIDQFLARFTDIMFAFPGLLFTILVAGIFGDWADATLSKIPIVGPNGNARLLLVSLALALTIWPLMARYVRGQTFQLKEPQFVEAARTSGTSDARIIFRHIIPNLFSIVVIAATLDIVNIVITEAAISYLG